MGGRASCLELVGWVGDAVDRAELVQLWAGLEVARAAMATASPVPGGMRCRRCRCRRWRPAVVCMVGTLRRRGDTNHMPVVSRRRWHRTTSRMLRQEGRVGAAGRATTEPARENQGSGRENQPPFSFDALGTRGLRFRSLRGFGPGGEHSGRFFGTNRDGGSRKATTDPGPGSSGPASAGTQLGRLRPEEHGGRTPLRGHGRRPVISRFRRRRGSPRRRRRGEPREG